jgi:hypothetical protein
MARMIRPECPARIKHGHGQENANGAATARLCRIAVHGVLNGSLEF